MNKVGGNSAADASCLPRAKLARQLVGPRPPLALGAKLAHCAESELPHLGAAHDAEISLIPHFPPLQRVWELETLVRSSGVEGTHQEPVAIHQWRALPLPPAAREETTKLKQTGSF